MKIVVINLDRATDRWERFKTRAVELECFDTTERFSAIDKKNKELVDELLKTYKVPYNTSCYVSHLKVLEAFLESTDEYVCVLEDDAYILNSGFLNIQSVCDDIHVQPTFFDIIYLSNRWRKNKNHQATIGCGTEAYIVSRKGASKMLALLYPSKTCIDLRMGQLHHSRFRGVNFDKALVAYVSKVQYVKHDDKGYSYLTAK